VRNHLRRGARYDSRAPGETDSDRPDSVSTTIWNEKMVVRFTTNYLRRDGVFLLRLIAHNTNGITTSEITRELWDLWCDVQQQQQQSRPKAIEANEFIPFNDDRNID